ncbi:coiled-coil domain-containing protein 83 isoform X1 [Lepisosteus oculatus]|uniref:coiled-coil domain-containing protein 83 isoform X1 n=2 Tax=Lepisosteus oculatus TaxID=7918 RepID=UPI0037129F14
MGKKKSASAEDKMTLAEAFITFQIQVKRKEIEEFQSEVSQLEEKNQRHKKRKEQLKEEQMGHIRTLLKQAKEQERDLEQRVVVNREQVDQALHKYWELARSKDSELEELRDELNTLQQKVLVVMSEKQCWLEYKTVGSQEHNLQIQLLEAELTQMQKDFQEMADHIQRSFDVTINEIDKKTEKLINEKKHLASEKAIKHLDKYTRQEIKENEWLKREIAIYKQEVALLEVSVQKHEEENLEQMNMLFQHRLDDLNISRQVFLTQVAGLGVADSGMLGEDFKINNLSDQTDASSRPINSLLATAEGEKGPGLPGELERDETVTSCSKPAGSPTGSPSQDLRALLYGSQVNFQESMHLGPLELKLLSVVGQAVPILPAPSSTSQDCNTEASQQQVDEWPVTPKMIHAKFKDLAHV